eukprot:15457957-Alexandrium_andersonii.AAC.1
MHEPTQLRRQGGGGAATQRTPDDKQGRGHQLQRITTRSQAEPLLNATPLAGWRNPNSRDRATRLTTILAAPTPGRQQECEARPATGAPQHRQRKCA